MRTIQTIALTLMASILYGQDITGQWNGALRVQGKEIRLIFHVNKANSQYEATMDSPDQNASGLKVTIANFNYPNVKLEISDLGAVYEGTLSNESISGKWIQSGTVLFLALLKKEDTPAKDK
jgi:uncharacterized protein